MQYSIHTCLLTTFFTFIYFHFYHLFFFYHDHELRRIAGPRSDRSGKGSKAYRETGPDWEGNGKDKGTLQQLCVARLGIRAFPAIYVLKMNPPIVSQKVPIYMLNCWNMQPLLISLSAPHDWLIIVYVNLCINYLCIDLIYSYLMCLKFNLKENCTLKSNLIIARWPQNIDSLLGLTPCYTQFTLSTSGNCINFELNVICSCSY